MLTRLATVLVLLAVAALASPLAMAAVRDHYFTPLGSEKGLTQNSITAFAQDAQGFIWVGTQGGLHRYDGQRYIPYRHDPSDAGSLPDNFVTARAPAGERTLWIGTYSQYVSRLDLRNGQVQRFSTADGDPASAQVMAMLPQGERLWVGTLNGLERMDPATGRSVQVVKLESHLLREGPHQQLILDANGTLWYASAAGLFRVAAGDEVRQQGLYVAVLADITDQKRAEQELRFLANYDLLTGLPNRTMLSERLSRAIVRARRNGRRIAVLFLDLDRFKDINDSLGHAAGDRILRAAAHRLQEAAGDRHTVARLGGDEFTVVMENIDSAQEAQAMARKLIAAFDVVLNVDERHEVTISPSIGISLYPEHAQVPSELLKHADTAMYRAKASGRRTFTLYSDEMDLEVRRRATISAALRNVLDRNELRLVYQPRLSLTDGSITGTEALLRWESPDYGNISPVQFIPLAEENGMILPIGEWALREACNTLKHWREQDLHSISMAVNVSALQLLRGDLPDTVARILSDAGLPTHKLELELTESVIMTNAELTASTLHALRMLGVGLAIDDFGTGYSSLAYLKRLPITTLKIDKEFIDDLTLDPDDEAITSTIIAMARSLGLNVVAEGVDNDAQVRFLRDHGCDEIQGYWLARPMEAEQCLAFLKEFQSSRYLGEAPSPAVGSAELP